MIKFYLILTDSNRDSIESLFHIIQPIIREITPIINTLEYDNGLIQPVLSTIIHIGILIGKIGLYCPDVVSLAIPDLIRFGQDALSILQSNPSVHINPTISPIYYSLYDTFKPLNWQLPASKIDFRFILDTSLWLKLSCLAGVKEIFPSLKTILNREYLNSIVLDTNFSVFPVNTRNLTISRTQIAWPRGNLITVGLTNFLDSVYNNPIRDIMSDALQREGFMFQVQDLVNQRIGTLYNLPAQNEELLSEINNLSRAILNCHNNSLPSSDHFMTSIMSLSGTINAENEERINRFIRDIQAEWSLSEPNGFQVVANLRTLRALESAFKFFNPDFVSNVPNFWFENMQ